MPVQHMEAAHTWWSAWTVFCEKGGTVDHAKPIRGKVRITVVHLGDVDIKKHTFHARIFVEVKVPQVGWLRFARRVC